MVAQQSPPSPSRRAGSKTVNKMFCVYLLEDKNGKLYIGYTSNLKRRIKEHNGNRVYTTRRMAGPKLVYFEAYKDEGSAKLRERKLKQYGSSYRGLIKRLGLKK